VTAPLLDIRDLSVRFGPREVVAGFDLAVHAGETVALVGESGCGKSTVALAALGLLPSGAIRARGRISLFGEDTAGWSERRLRAVRGGQVAMIFQDASSALNPVFTIGDQIVEAIRLHSGLGRRAARTRAIELLDLVAVPDPQRRIDAWPHQLSGGLRQRALIAMAVATSPRLLIADEPTTALDVTTQAQVLALIDRLRRELAMAVLLITHDLGVVADHADRAVVMYAGTACEQAPVATLLARPLHPYTQGLMAARPEQAAPGSRLPEIAGDVASAWSAPGCRYAPRCTRAVSACAKAPPAALAIDAAHRLACPVAANEIAHAPA
jgi:peptide/nickel transport system ATP-binding protein